MSKVIIKARRLKGKTIVSNDRGDKWESPGNMPERYAIAALVEFTLERYVSSTAFYSNDFEIEMIVRNFERKKSEI